MTIIVTGGAGFIGSNFIAYTLEKHPDDRVVCFDKLTYAGNLENLSEVWNSKNFRFVKGDICDVKAVRDLFDEERPDAVINFAAESHVDRSIKDPSPFLQTNVVGASVLMDACKDFGVKRFHQVSTDEVYGDLPLDKFGVSFDENCPVRPSSPYSASKAAADLLGMAYYRTYNLPITISRCSNNYGPRQFKEKLIPVAIVNALSETSIPVYGKGENVRDWLYVVDHCSALDLILRNGRVGEIYNIGGGAELNNLEVVRHICRLLGKSQKLITFVKDRQGHDLRYAVNTFKIEKELGWTAKTQFCDGLKSTVDWYLVNRDWWDN